MRRVGSILFRGASIGEMGKANHNERPAKFLAPSMGPVPGDSTAHVIFTACRISESDLFPFFSVRYRFERWKSICKQFRRHSKWVAGVAHVLRGRTPLQPTLQRAAQERRTRWGRDDRS